MVRLGLERAFCQAWRDPAIFDYREHVSQAYRGLSVNTVGLDKAVHLAQRLACCLGILPNPRKGLLCRSKEGSLFNVKQSPGEEEICCTFDPDTNGGLQCKPVAWA